MLLCAPHDDSVNVHWFYS